MSDTQFLRTMRSAIGRAVQERFRKNLAANRAQSR
jgi:hypothetical protein